MILHTIIDINDIFRSQDGEDEGVAECVSLGNAFFMGERIDGNFLIKRVISTNPKDYLNKSYDIGNALDFNADIK